MKVVAVLDSKSVPSKGMQCRICNTIGLLASSLVSEGAWDQTSMKKHTSQTLAFRWNGLSLPPRTLASCPNTLASCLNAPVSHLWRSIGVYFVPMQQIRPCPRSFGSKRSTKKHTSQTLAFAWNGPSLPPPGPSLHPWDPRPHA